MISGSSLHNAFADIIPPKKQIALGISADDISCETGTFKLIKETTSTPACVKISHVIQLIANGWAKPVKQEHLDAQVKQDATVFSTINKLYAQPIKAKTGTVSSSGAIAGYDFAFEVCASFLKIYVPDIIVKSDSETQHYEIPENIEKNSCVLSATFIKASNPDSITVTLLNKGDISQTLSDGEATIASLQQELDTAKKLLGDPSSPDTSQILKIIDLRKQINDAKEDLYRLYFTVYAVPTEKYNIQKLSFTGEPIEGDSAKLITAKKSISTPNTYDTIFEACAGKNQITLPIVMISSDKESSNVKIGNKISANTCQMTSAKITAINPDTISVKMAGNTESDKIPDLENQINNLQKQIQDERDMIRTLLNDKNKKSDFNDQMEMHTKKIIDLRGQISSLKDDYNDILYRAYRQ
ncbi:MAG: hypothetical protein K8Q89_00950 [Nitrosarchaeum sp.]|nr:hypothetical protein [Nitrosarchaeum sp.]